MGYLLYVWVLVSAVLFMLKFMSSMGKDTVDSAVSSIMWPITLILILALTIIDLFPSSKRRAV